MNLDLAQNKILLLYTVVFFIYMTSFMNIDKYSKRKFRNPPKAHIEKLIDWLVVAFKNAHDNETVKFLSRESNLPHSHIIYVAVSLIGEGIGRHSMWALLPCRWRIWNPRGQCSNKKERQPKH